MLKSLLKSIFIFSILVSSCFAKNYTVYINGAMDDNKDFHKNLVIIGHATHYDNIILVIDSPGGRIDVMLSYQKAMAISGAYTISYVCNYCTAISAAGILSVSVNEIHLMRHSIWMAHQAKSEGKPLNDITMFLYSECCKNILTKQDFVYILNGGEIWLSGKEVMDRLNNAEYIKKLSN